MPPRILIAEDDDLQGAIVRSALQSRGYQADIVSDGLEAVRRLRTVRYDLALLDYHLPEVDGLAAARLLHEFLRDEDRPRLIAITATAEGLCEKLERSGGPCFDAVVSKGLGLSALLSVVDANLTCAAELNAASVIRHGQAAAREAAVVRRRRWLSPLAAIPALVMVAAFGAAFAWAAASLRHVDAVIGSAQRTDALSINTAALVGAVQAVEASQRTYLATGLAANREVFQTDAQRVDQLLVSPAPLAADGAPGGAAVQTVIEPRLRVLAEEAERHTAGSEVGQPVSTGRDAAENMQNWASAVVSGSLLAVFAGLDAVRHNVELVLAVLGAGVLYGLWNAGRAVQRRWRGTNRARPAPNSGAWIQPRPASLTAPRATMLALPAE